MGWFGDNHDTTQSYNNYQSAPKHEAHLSHELLAGAAAYEASKSYEKHVAANGRPPSHAKAKEILAGFTGAIVDREVETHGLNFLDKERAKHEAKKQAEEGLSQYGGY